jgi:hypothetical protein
MDSALLTGHEVIARVSVCCYACRVYIHLGPDSCDCRLINRIFSHLQELRKSSPELGTVSGKGNLRCRVLENNSTQGVMLGSVENQCRGGVEGVSAPSGCPSDTDAAASCLTRNRPSYGILYSTDVESIIHEY